MKWFQICQSALSGTHLELCNVPKRSLDWYRNRESILQESALVSILIKLQID